MRDTVNVTRQGIPCVGLVHERFEKLAVLQATQLGMRDVQLLIYPQDQPSLDPPELVEQKAREVAARIPDFLLGRKR